MQAHNGFVAHLQFLLFVAPQAKLHVFLVAVWAKGCLSDQSMPVCLLLNPS
jgi:hypothetical protein